MAVAKDIELSTITAAYARWAPIYDSIYARLLREGQREAARLATQDGIDILEVGVGTGLGLADYPASHRVTGIDLSKPMLDRAMSKVERMGASAVLGLSVMDACRLGFRDASFDAVVGQYVITLVPDAETALDEFARVVRPGGSIILVNHIGAEKGLIASWEKAIAPLAKRLGWRSEFPLQRIRDWGQSRGFELELARPVGPLGFFRLMQLRDRRLKVMTR